jgi:gas vesicle structural protein
MTRARDTRREPSVLETVLDAPEGSLLDVIDRLLNKGVLATGDVTLGVAGIDLIYLRLSTILCAADRVLPPAGDRAPRRSRRRAPSRRGRA